MNVGHDVVQVQYMCMWIIVFIVFQGSGEVDGSGVCVCDDGYHGTQCESCRDGFYSDTDGNCEGKLKSMITYCKGGTCTLCTDYVKTHGLKLCQYRGTFCSFFFLTKNTKVQCTCTCTLKLSLLIIIQCKISMFFIC